MAGVVKKTASQKIPGTKISLQNSQLITSSGIPSLDHVIGGGLPLGSVFLIEEDTYGKYSNVMFKYFLSEGIVCKHNIFLSTLDTNPEKLISDLPAPTNAEIEISSDKQTSLDDELKIAWRYNSLSAVQSTLDSNLQFGHYFDISKRMDEDLIKNASIDIWKLKNINSIENPAYSDLLVSLKNKILESKMNAEESKNVLRVGMNSIGSPYWQRFDKCESNNANEGKSLLKFVYCLRAIVRSTCTVVLLTVPTHLYQNNDTRLHLLHSVDGCIKLESFSGTDRENDTVLRDYHGLFFLPKLLSMNTISPYVPPTLDLAFKLRRKKFLIEKLHLPPELQDSSEREQDDGTISCGSIKKKNLDF